MTSTLGVMYLVQGIGSIIGAPIVGAICVAVGSFDIGFYIAGAIFVAASLCSFAAQAIHMRKQLKIENNTVSGPIEVQESTL